MCVCLALLTRKRNTGLYPSLIPPALILSLYILAGAQQDVPASQVLMPRYDESSSPEEYYINLERTQQSMLFLVRLYDNLVYHCQHASLTPAAYKAMFLGSLVVSSLLWLAGRWIILAVGLVILLHKTWLGTALEVAAQFLMEFLQTVMDTLILLAGKRRLRSTTKVMEISVYENQRWWAGTGYTSQVKYIHINHPARLLGK